MGVYGQLMRELRDNYLHGNNVYPRSLDEAFVLLQNHSRGKRRGDRNNSNNYNRRGNSNDEFVPGVQHAQQRGHRGHSNDNPVAGFDGRINPNIKCYSCEKYGHYADNCPQLPRKEDGAITEGQQHHMHGATLDTISDDEDGESLVFGFTYLSAKAEPDRNAILLDTGSNCSIFNNKSLLTDVRPSLVKLRAYTNGGHQDSSQVGRYADTFDVWFNPNSMVNILSFTEVCKRYRVTIDTAEGNSFIVHLDTGSTMIFSEVESGLYLLNNSNNITNDVIIHYSTNLQLVDDNKRIYSKREIEGADLAKQLYKHRSMPNYNTFIKLIESNFFRNCPITTLDVKRAIHIYGKEPAVLKGKSTRPNSKSIQQQLNIPIPQTVQSEHSNISISIDYVFLQGIPVLHSISGTSYQFRTLELIFKAKASKGDILKGYVTSLTFISLEE